MQILDSPLSDNEAREYAEKYFRVTEDASYNTWQTARDLFDRGVPLRIAREAYKNANPEDGHFGGEECEKLESFYDDFDPKSFGSRSGKFKRRLFKPFELGEPALVKPREWIYRPVYIRKYVTLTAARGGTGKSSLVMTEAIAMATGRSLLGIKPSAALRIGYFNGEDPKGELDLRFHGICLHYGISADDLEGNLFYDNGRDMPIKLATGNGISKPDVNEVLYAIRHNKLDHMTIDPFVSSHSVNENSTELIESVAKQWGHIADEANCSIGLVHHVRKSTTGKVAAIEDSRGASSLIDAARVRRIVNTMTVEQARAAGISPERRGYYISSDLSRSNLGPPDGSLTYYELLSVDLNNGLDGNQADEIGVPMPFDYKTATDIKFDDDDRERMLAVIRKRTDWRKSDKAADWIGNAMAAAVGLRLDAFARKRIASLIIELLEDGTLQTYTGQDDKRMKRTFIRIKE